MTLPIRYRREDDYFTDEGLRGQSMVRQPTNLLEQAVLLAASKDVGQYQRRHARVLATLGVGLAVAVLCHDWWEWFPRWPTYILLVIIVFDSVFHGCIEQGFADDEREKWKKMLSLVHSVQQQALFDANNKPTLPKPSKPNQQGGPQLRVFKPDTEPPQKRS